MGRKIQATENPRPPHNDGVSLPLDGPGGRGNRDEIENQATVAGLPQPGDEVTPELDFLELVREAEQQAAQYIAQINRAGWSQAYKAFHNEHFTGSKYTRPDYRNRSQLFRPKTRSAVRKDMASVAASLFNQIDAINCLPGDEGDPIQRGAAAVMEELVNYRTDRTSGKASIPWFLVSIGARQDAMITGICLSKQSWRLELRRETPDEAAKRAAEEAAEAAMAAVAAMAQSSGNNGGVPPAAPPPIPPAGGMPPGNETQTPPTQAQPMAANPGGLPLGQPPEGGPPAQVQVSAEVAPGWLPKIDRPDCQLIPPENFIIDPSTDWTDPAQNAQYIIIKWPMQIEEVRAKQQSPINPWLKVDEAILTGSVEDSRIETAAIRRARERGTDRFQRAQQTSQTFKIVWVYEVFMRVADEDWTFLSISDRAYLTEPKRTIDVYPEQGGERPLVLGYGSLESHRLFPMSAVESWQMMQHEVNELVNLSLDAIKQNVMPVSKVRRGRQIDVDQVRKRSQGSSIMVSQPDDVTWERPPDIPQSIPLFMRDIELEMDDLAGQFNGQSAEMNNALSRTLGGLRLVAGSANAVQEFDIRVWLETWTNPVLAQIVKLEQYYEHDPIILGLCGDRAKLMQKHGISEISDQLMEQEVTIRINVGLGAGDPQARLQRFGSATQVAMPLLQASPEFQRGELEVDAMAVMEEVYGAAGYRDGGRRFVKPGQPQQQNPLMDLQAQKLQADIVKSERQGKSSLLTGLAAVAKVALGNKQLEADQTNSLLDGVMQATDMGHGHAMEHKKHALEQSRHILDQTQTGFDHGMAVNQHHAARADAAHQQGMDIAQHQAGREDAAHQQNMDRYNAASAASDNENAGGGGKGGPPPAAASPQPPPPPEPPQPAAAPAPPAPRPVPIRYDFQRDPHTGRIVAAIPIYSDQPPAAPSAHNPLRAPFPPPVSRAA